jgi:hypothetical protein
VRSATPSRRTRGLLEAGDVREQSAADEGLLDLPANHGSPHAAARCEWLGQVKPTKERAPSPLPVSPFRELVE